MNNVSKLVLNTQDLVSLTREQWFDIGYSIIQAGVLEDAKKGIMQDGSSGHKYRNKRYASLKARGMRLTTRKDKEGNKIKSTKGDRVTFKGVSYKSVSILSTNISFVDLTLTGRMLNSLHPSNASSNWLEMSFGKTQIKKVIGNWYFGYRVLGVNLKILARIKGRINQYLGKKFISRLPQKLIIDIKFFGTVRYS